MATSITDRVAARFAEMSRSRSGVHQYDDSPEHITAPSFPVTTSSYLNYAPSHQHTPVRERTIYIGPSSPTQSPPYHVGALSNGSEQQYSSGSPDRMGEVRGGGMITTRTNVISGLAAIGSPPGKRLPSESRNDRFVHSSNIEDEAPMWPTPQLQQATTRAPSTYSTTYSSQQPIYYPSGSRGGDGGGGRLHLKYATSHGNSTASSVVGGYRPYNLASGGQSSTGFVYPLRPSGRSISTYPTTSSYFPTSTRAAPLPPPAAPSTLYTPTLERDFYPVTSPGAVADSFDRERASLRVDRAEMDEECPPGPQYDDRSDAMEPIPLLEAASDPTLIERAYPHSSSAVRRTVANFNGLMIPIPPQLLPVAFPSVDGAPGGNNKRAHAPGSSNPFSLVEMVCLCRELRGMDGTAKSSILAPSPAVNAAFVNILLAGADMAMYTTTKGPQVRFVRLDVIKEADGQFVPVIAWSQSKNSYQASGHISLHELIQVTDAHGDCPAFSRHLTGRTKRMLDADDIALRINGETGGTGIKGPIVGGGRPAILSSDNCVRMLFVGGVELCWISLHNSVAKGWMGTLRYILEELHIGSHPEL